MKIRLLIYFLAVSQVLFGYENHQHQINDTTQYNTIEFVKSPYGLIFTTIEIDGEEINAMIDFGDPNVLQLSSKIVEKLMLSIRPTGHKAYFITGESFDIHEGDVDQVKIGNRIEKKVSFSSSPSEMESVSKQIGTEFNAVIGWGYFKQYYTSIDYKQNKFVLYKDYQEPQEVFAQIYFDNSTTHLSIPVTINDMPSNAIIDTGSPVTLVDRKFLAENNMEKPMIKIGDKSIPVAPYLEDLSMLSDLEVNSIIGGDVLQLYKVFIDPFESTMFFYN